MSTEITKQAIDSWESDTARSYRYNLLMDLAFRANLSKEFSTVPRIHLEQMSYDKFMITVQGLAKIRELRRFNEQEGNKTDSSTAIK